MSTKDFSVDNILVGGNIKGPATFYLDPAADDTAEPGGSIVDSGTVVILGNLEVTGSTSRLNTHMLDVEDINITVARGKATSADADGGGLTVDGANATIVYSDAGNSWVFNKAPYFLTERILTTADLGSGSGIDADLLDGQDSPYYLDYANFTGNPTLTITTNSPSGNGALSYDSNTGAFTYTPPAVTLDNATTNGNTTTNDISVNTLTSTVAQGTAPLVVASDTLVSNLNADKLDNKEYQEIIEDATALAIALG